MSRKIKFRIWDKEYNCYDDFNSIKINQKGVVFDKDYDWQEEVWYDKPDKEHNFVLEQYTGLKDKNGKEIYEGDIVKMPKWQVKTKYEIVKYRKAGFEPFQEGCWDCCKPDGEEVEIIGNIHENPELIGGEE